MPFDVPAVEEEQTLDPKLRTFSGHRKEPCRRVLRSVSCAQTEREEKMAEVRAMRKQEREFNRKKEYARRCRIQFHRQSVG